MYVHERSAYITYNKVDYFGYDLYSDTDFHQTSLVSQDIVEKATGQDNSLFTTQAVKLGSELTIVPDCAIALADIRKSYVIKRKLDAGDYNVFSPIKDQYYHSYTGFCIIIPSLKKVYYQYYTYNKKIEDLQRAILYDHPGLSINDLLTIPTSNYRLKKIKLTDGWKNLLEGKLTKPSILISSLSINSQQKLTVDALYIAYKAAYSYDGALGTSDVEKYELQLNVLNNYNWRDYPGTMTLYNDLTSASRLVQYCKSHTSSFSKTIRNILKNPNTEFVSEEDYNLGLQLFQRIMNLGERKIVSLGALTEKMSSNHVSRCILNTFYSQAVRLEARNYENYRTD